MKRLLSLRRSALFAIITAAAVSMAAFDIPGTTAPPKQPSDNDYMDLVGEAEKAISANNYEAAVACIKRAIDLEPDNPSNILLMSNLAMVYSYMDQDTLALLTYDETLRQAPNMTTVRNNRALLLAKMGRDKEAFNAFAGVIDADSLNATARYYHGIMALYSSRLDIAEVDFDVLKSVAPDSRHTAVALSSLYSMTQRNLEAIPYFKKLVKDSPDPEFYASLAGCYLALGRLSEASETIADGLKRYAYDPELYYYRAWLNRDRFRLDEAHDDARKAIALGANAAKVNALFAPQDQK
ncbi:MAG: tetratricopeptide repeat protein [Muribaculaceae bacterium]